VVKSFHLVELATITVNAAHDDMELEYLSKKESFGGERDFLWECIYPQFPTPVGSAPTSDLISQQQQQ